MIVDGIVITVEIGIAIWGISFCVGFIFGAILRVSFVIHALIAVFLSGWQIRSQGVRDYVATLVIGWIVVLIVVMGMLPGYLCGYFATDVLYRQMIRSR